MARVKVVDYLAMPGLAEEMRGGARQLNKELIDAHDEIEKMHSFWHGRRYNALVKSFNDIIPEMNKMLTLVLREIPDDLQKVANNYSLADRGFVAEAVKTENPNILVEAPIINDETMGFESASAEAVREKVSTNFKNAIELMDRIETIFRKVTWDSESGQVFKDEFTKSKNRIVTAFENINTQFVKCMQQAQTDIETAERGNTLQ